MRQNAVTTETYQALRQMLIAHLDEALVLQEVAGATVVKVDAVHSLEMTLRDWGVSWNAEDLELLRQVAPYTTR